MKANLSKNGVASATVKTSAKHYAERRDGHKSPRIALLAAMMVAIMMGMMMTNSAKAAAWWSYIYATAEMTSDYKLKIRIVNPYCDQSYQDTMSAYIRVIDQYGYDTYYTPSYILGSKIDIIHQYAGDTERIIYVTPAPNQTIMRWSVNVYVGASPYNPYVGWGGRIDLVANGACNCSYVPNTWLTIRKIGTQGTTRVKTATNLTIPAALTCYTHYAFADKLSDFEFSSPISFTSKSFDIDDLYDVLYLKNEPIEVYVALLKSANENPNINNSCILTATAINGFNKRSAAGNNIDNFTTAMFMGNTLILNIEFETPGITETARLQIHGLDGSLIATSEHVIAGTNTIYFDANHLTSGTYYYSLTIDSETLLSNNFVVVK